MANLYSRQLLSLEVDKNDFCRLMQLTDSYNYLRGIAAQFDGWLTAVDPTELVNARSAFDIKIEHSRGLSTLNVQGWSEGEDDKLETEGPYLGQLSRGDPLLIVDGASRLEHMAGLRRTGGLFELEILFVDANATYSETAQGYDVDSLTDPDSFFNPGMRKIVVE